jgi:hypothetical protein
MKRKQLQKIKELSIFIFNEKEYSRFINSIINTKYNEARLFLDYINEKFEYNLQKLEFQDDNQLLLIQYKKIDKLMDIVIELIIVNEDRKCKRKQISSIT